MNRTLERRILTNRALADQLDERLETTRAPRRFRSQAHDTPSKAATIARATSLSFDSPTSSTILAAQYDPDTEVLTVHFKRGKTEKAAGVYTYQGFPMPLWMKFREAESKGQFFATHIRPIYKGVTA